MTIRALIAAIAAATAVLALAYNVIQNRRARRKKIVWMITRSELVSLSKAGDASADDTVEVERIVELKWINVGHVELKRSDFDERPGVEISSGEIVGVDIKQKLSGSDKLVDRKPACTTDKKILLPKLLMNPKDEVSFTLRIRGDTGEVTSIFHAAGFAFKPAKGGQVSKSQKVTFLIAGVALVISIVSAALSFFS